MLKRKGGKVIMPKKSTRIVNFMELMDRQCD